MSTTKGSPNANWFFVERTWEFNLTYVALSTDQYCCKTSQSHCGQIARAERQLSNLQLCLSIGIPGQVDKFYTGNYRPE